MREAARLLAAAERPVIVADRAARTAAGMRALVALAEALAAPVVDQGGRMQHADYPRPQSERPWRCPGRAGRRHPGA